MTNKQKPYNASRKQMWLVQAILAGRKLILSGKNDELFLYAIEDLITAEGRSFLKEPDPQTLNIRDISCVRLCGSSTEYPIGKLNIVNIDHSEQVEYPPALCRNTAEAVLKRRYQTLDFLNYLQTCNEEEQKNLKQNSEDDEQAGKYSYKKELAEPLRTITDGSCSEKNIYAPLDVFFGKSHPPAEHNEELMTVQYDRNNSVTGAIIRQTLQENNVVFISGPPGTGKTTVLRDLIISAYLNGKTILFTSKNNAAIDAAYNKTTAFFKNEESWLPVPVLRCGNKEIREEYYAKTIRMYFHPAEDFLKQTEDLPVIKPKPESFAYVEDRTEILKYAVQRIRQNILFLDRVYKNWREWKEDTTTHKLFNSYRRSNNSFLSAFPIVFSTCDSLPSVCEADPANPPFDIVIIDEASQCPLTDGLLAVMRAKTLVLAGDMYQLRPVNTVRDSTDRSRQKEWKIDNTYQYSNKSLFGTFMANDPYAVSTNRYFRLLNHYRCVPDIIRFSNERYYSGALCVKTKKRSAQPLSLIDITCRDSSGETELAVVMNLIRQLIGTKLNGTVIRQSDIAVISPFRKNHIDKLKDLLRINYSGVHAGTIHEFQGSEFRVVILTTGLKPRQLNAYDQLVYTNMQLINVGITRAMERFILVNNSKLMDSYSKQCRKKRKEKKKGREKEEKAIAVKETLEESRQLWQISSVDDLPALYDYVKNNTADIRLITELEALGEEELPVNQIDLVKEFTERLIKNRTFNYSETADETKPSLVRINKTGTPDREGTALKLMIGKNEACVIDVAEADSSDTLKQLCKKQKIPYVLLNKNERFSDDRITETIGSLLERNPLKNDRMQCYCGSSWLMNLFLNGPYTADDVYTDEANGITCRFRTSDYSDAILTWYDKCLLDVIYTCYRRGDKTVSAEHLIQMMNGDYSKRMTKTSASELNEAVARLEKTTIILSFTRDITEFKKSEVIREAPLLKIRRRSATKFDLTEFELKTCLPLYAVAEERMNIYTSNDEYLKIDRSSQAFLKMKADRIAVPNNAFLLNRYIFSRINSLIHSKRYGGRNFYFNDIVLIDRSQGTECGILKKLGYAVSGGTQSDMNRISDLRRYIDSLMRWYEETGLIISHYYTGTSSKQMFLSFEYRYHCLNEAEFSKYVKRMKNDAELLADLRRLDCKTPVDILYRFFCLGETLDHIHRSMIRNRNTDLGIERATQLIYWFSRQIRTYVLPLMENEVFASETIAENQIKLSDKSNKHLNRNQKITAVCSAGNKKPYMMFYQWTESYPYLPEDYQGNIILPEITEELRGKYPNRIFQNWDVLQTRSCRNLEQLQDNKPSGNRKAEEQYQIAYELDTLINQFIHGIKTNAETKILLQHRKEISGFIEVIISLNMFRMLSSRKLGSNDPLLSLHTASEQAV